MEFKASGEAKVVETDGLVGLLTLSWLRDGVIALRGLGVLEEGLLGLCSAYVTNRASDR